MKSDANLRFYFNLQNENDIFFNDKIFFHFSIYNELLYQLSYFGDNLFMKSDANLRFYFNLQNENDIFFNDKIFFHFSIYRRIKKRTASL